MSPGEPCGSCDADEPERDCWICGGRGQVFACRNGRCQGREVAPQARTSADYGYASDSYHAPRGSGPVAHHHFVAGRCLHCGKLESLAGRHGWACRPE